ncbi:GGDEF domain-containing protein [Desnuesiella massiliensis]|uniref:GGDEF domain-containing protein n=1 Tax=Desnuesiella massiliensis TaxID=1650662 RepID=UPI0018A84ADF|nr:GGDEF domain-containing protein [Desnuesiella massiliensis]
MRRFFYRFMPVILLVNAFILHVLGYFIDFYVAEKYDLFIWLMVTVIAMFFSFVGAMKIQTLYSQAYKDSLTGLGNRSFFYLEMKYKMEQTRKRESSISLLMVDVDNFKEFNDKYGHISGDNILKQIAGIFMHNVRVNDSVVRWGGEEFAIILPDTDADGAYRLAERIRRMVEENNFSCEQDILCKVTISIGVVTVQEKTEINYLIGLADKALYKAKGQGRNRVSLFDRY